jgi:predicted transcriptional regulator
MRNRVKFRLDASRFNLGGRGLTRVLGELEARIMEAVWELGSPTGREITSALGTGSHYKTVLTVANRLVEKGLFIREPMSERVYRYRAVESRDAFLERFSAAVANGLVEDFGRNALAQLVRAADEVDPVYLDELERLVRERRER